MKSFVAVAAIAGFASAEYGYEQPAEVVADATYPEPALISPEWAEPPEYINIEHEGCGACDCTDCHHTKTWTKTFPIFCPTGVVEHPWKIVEVYKGMNEPVYVEPTGVPKGFKEVDETCDSCGDKPIHHKVIYPEDCGPFIKEKHVEEEHCDKCDKDHHKDHHNEHHKKPEHHCCPRHHEKTHEGDHWFGFCCPKDAEHCIGVPCEDHCEGPPCEEHCHDGHCKDDKKHHPHHDDHKKHHDDCSDEGCEFKEHYGEEDCGDEGCEFKEHKKPEHHCCPKHHELTHEGDHWFGYCCPKDAKGCIGVPCEEHCEGPPCEEKCEGPDCHNEKHHHDDCGEEGCEFKEHYGEDDCGEEGCEFKEHNKPEEHCCPQHHEIDFVGECWLGYCCPVGAKDCIGVPCEDTCEGPPCKGKEECEGPDCHNEKHHGEEDCGEEGCEFEEHLGEEGGHHEPAPAPACCDAHSLEHCEGPPCVIDEHKGNNQTCVGDHCDEGHKQGTDHCDTPPSEDDVAYADWEKECFVTAGAQRNTLAAAGTILIGAFAAVAVL